MAKVDRLVYHEPTDQRVVLTPSGDVYINFSTNDPTNLVYAVGGLFDDNWRYATPDEFFEWNAQRATTTSSKYFDWSRVVGNKNHLHLVPKSKPKLYLIK